MARSFHVVEILPRPYALTDTGAIDASPERWRLSGTFMQVRNARRWLKRLHQQGEVARIIFKGEEEAR